MGPPFRFLHSEPHYHIDLKGALLSPRAGAPLPLRTGR
jgi:hypothetical protein